MHVLTGILKNKTEHRTTNKLKYLKEQKAEISALLMIELSWDLYIDWKTRLLCQVCELWAQSAEAQSTSPPNGIAADTARLWEQACRWTRVWMCSTDMPLITAWVHVLTALNCCCNEQLTCCWSAAWLTLPPATKERQIGRTRSLCRGLNGISVSQKSCVVISCWPLRFPFGIWGFVNQCFWCLPKIQL